MEPVELTDFCDTIFAEIRFSFSTFSGTKSSSTGYLPLEKVVKIREKMVKSSYKPKQR
jgi:hypothetical protein